MSADNIVNVSNTNAGISAEEELELVRAGLSTSRNESDAQEALDNMSIDDLLAQALKRQPIAEDEEAPECGDDDSLDEWDSVDEEDSPSALKRSSVSATESAQTDAEPDLAVLEGGDPSASKPSTANAQNEGFTSSARSGFGPEHASFDESLSESPRHGDHHQAMSNPAGSMASYPHYTPEQQIKVGLFQGLSMLGGAGLASLSSGIRSGASSIRSNVRRNQFQKLTNELDALSADVDAAVDQLNDNGLAVGLNGLSGSDRDDFIKEFIEIPANRKSIDTLMSSIGQLATKSSKATLAGAEAGMSHDELDLSIGRRIADLQKRHASTLTSLTDHSGQTLAERLANIAQMISDVIDRMFAQIDRALNPGPRLGN